MQAHQAPWKPREASNVNKWTALTKTLAGTFNVVDEAENGFRSLIGSVAYSGFDNIQELFTYLRSAYFLPAYVAMERGWAEIESGNATKGFPKLSDMMRIIADGTSRTPRTPFAGSLDEALVKF